jgi:hypothetical protein
MGDQADQRAWLLRCAALATRWLTHIYSVTPLCPHSLFPRSPIYLAHCLLVLTHSRLPPRTMTTPEIDLDSVIDRLLAGAPAGSALIGKIHADGLCL